MDSKKKKTTTEEKKVYRKRDEHFTTVSLLVPREWSEKISEYSRIHGYTKTSLILKAVEDFIEKESIISLKADLAEINRKVDTLVTILPALIKQS